MAVDPVSLAQDLIRCPSVTPADAGALDVLERALTPLGFVCTRLKFDDPAPAVDNLYARLGTSGPNFCFAGHTDVVPPGDVKLWRSDPYAAEIRGGTLFGRGAVDMKTSIAAFVAAVAQHGTPKGSISLLITGDEEGPTNVNGTKKMLVRLAEMGERLDHCIVGEPTATAASGDVMKIGRRGTMTVRLTVTGTQGHVGYPHIAKNPIPALAELAQRLSDWKLDAGTPHFDPSTLSFTTLDVGNPATNVIPAEAKGVFNIRFNTEHSAESLLTHIKSVANEIAVRRGVEIAMTEFVGGVPFLTEPGTFTALLAEAVARVTGTAPEFSTTGGTSDARFIKDHCPVVELGLPGGTMHKADECVPVSEIGRLTEIYKSILDAYFESPPR
ncbi:MAG TPA: succinyl-diaminopimelate desuccinylase [Rhizomicrobium sp.]|jgi:succinyl-diaminopimelate desuccinylase|nr:succinyl-diaminopimelate desuccinylase [Rhizomicrobium sp.]